MYSIIMYRNLHKRKVPQDREAQKINKRAIPEVEKQGKEEK